MIFTRIVSVLALLSACFAFNERLESRGVNCYYENLKMGDQFSINFQVGTRDPDSSEQLDIDFYVLNPSQQKIINAERVSDGSYEVPVNVPGRYRICFSNEYSTSDKKDITFHVNHVWGSELRVEQYDTTEGQIGVLKRIVAELSQETEYLRVRERVHRNTAESTNDRVKWWSIAQLVVVAASVVFQVAYLKRFFEVKTNV